MALVEGGAHLDFRSRDGSTAVHKAAIKGAETLMRLPSLSLISQTRTLAGFPTLLAIICSRLCQGFEDDAGFGCLARPS